MQRYVELNSENRVISTTDLAFPQPTQSVYNFPENFDFTKQTDYKIIGSQLVYAPIPEPEYTPTEQERIRADVDLLLIESFVAKGVISGDAS